VQRSPEESEESKDEVYSEDSRIKPEEVVDPKMLVKWLNNTP
jgi:hypothetical protein